MTLSRSQQDCHFLGFLLNTDGSSVFSLQIRRRRPTPATLVASSDQSSPEGGGDLPHLRFLEWTSYHWPEERHIERGVNMVI
uniref:Uncharacterized protein n=1 Tax=Hucho hucho TaxID=62062 RepID=A0A4W5KF81_9TELE